MADGKITIGCELETKSFDKQIQDLENKIDDLEHQRLDFKAHGNVGELQEVELELEKTKNKLVQLNTQKEKLEKTSGLDGLGKSFEKSVKSAGRLVLAIFGIRSAYLGLRRASSDLASYDPQYAANLEYIRFVLTQAIAPILRFIVGLAMRLLQIINAIVGALFGVNLFSKGSAENFRKMKSGASGASKAIKQIKKDLLGFDEINKLTDQSDTGTSAGAGGVGMPSMDLSALQGEPPAWLKWIIDNRGEILSTLAGIAAGLLAIKLGLSGLQALGIGILVKGIIDLIISLRDYLNDPSWENFGRVIKGVGEILLGLGIIIGNVPLIVAGAIAIIIGLIIKNWDDIKAFLQKGIDWLKEKSDWIRDTFGENIGLIYDFFVNTFQRILNWAGQFFDGLKKIFDGFIQFFKGVFTGNWKDVWEGLGKIVSGVFQIIKSTLKLGLETLFDYAVTIASIAGNAIAAVFKKVVNAILGAIERILNKPINAINGLIGVVNSVPGVTITRLNTFSLPRLKSGAILNMPNKGTLVGGGSAIAGEAGHEGYLPLTDQQAMAELGTEIGRHVLINLTNITQMNGRVIGRELKQIKSEQDFAYNT